MALVIYPTDNWNSFVSVVDADTIIATFVSDNGYSQLDNEGKEAILIQTALQIRLCNNITLPSDTTSDLELAQCYLVTYALGTDMLAYDPNSRAVIEEHAGAVGTSYDSGMKAEDNSSFPSMVQSLLNQYGCSSSRGGFTQTYKGLS